MAGLGFYTFSIAFLLMACFGIAILVVQNQEPKPDDGDFKKRFKGSKVNRNLVGITMVGFGLAFAISCAMVGSGQRASAPMRSRRGSDGW